MPDYTVTVTATAGQPLAAADWNAGVRDNFAALGGEWTAYTPTWTTTGTAPAIGNGSVTGRYLKFGKTVHLRITLTMGTTTTYGTGTWVLSLPSGLTGVATQQLIPVTCVNTSVATYLGVAVLDPLATTILPTVYTGTAGGAVVLPSSTVPFSWGTGDFLTIQGTIEVA